MQTLFIDIDSLRADHTTPYGYEKSTTPNFDRLAEDSVVFNRAYVAASPCMPSRAALVSGRYAVNNGVATHGAAGRTMSGPSMWNDFNGADRNWWTLPETFFEERIHTAAVSSFPRHPSPWFYHLWHEFYQPQEPDGPDEYFQTPRAETVADRMIDLLETHEDEDFFLYAQFWDPHTPYNRSDEEIAEFDTGYVPPYPTAEQISDHQRWETWRSATSQDIADRDDLAGTIAHYDAEINYVDAQIGRVLDALEAVDLYDSTLIVVTADHGEEFGEHGLYREHWSTHEGTQRVPLIVKPPADEPVETGHREHLVTNVDLAPTLVDYADIQQPAAWQGSSLRPIVQSSDEPGRDSIVFEHGLYVAQRSVRTDSWKYIRTYNDGVWDIPEHQLFDMDGDPWEQDDIAKEHPEVVDDFRTRMARWVEDHVGREGDALRTVACEGPAGLIWASEG